MGSLNHPDDVDTLRAYAGAGARSLVSSFDRLVDERQRRACVIFVGEAQTVSLV